MQPTAPSSVPPGRRIFLSYSRRDAALAAGWVAALTACGHEVFQDTTSIPAGAEWRGWIREEIGRADTVLFMVSPHWLASVHCREELELAVADAKRLLPLCCGVGADALPDSLQPYNSVFTDAETVPPAALADVDQAVRADLDWLLIHRRLLQEAKDWESSGRPTSQLRARRDLALLDAALAARAAPQPPLNTLQTAYIGASRVAVEAQRRLRWVWGTASLAVLLALGVFAALQWWESREQAATATARRLLRAAEQQLSPDASPNGALRLALAARAAKPLPEVDDFLRRAMAWMPAPAAMAPALAASGPPPQWWKGVGVGTSPDGNTAWALLHDGQRGVRLLEMAPRTGGADTARELPLALPRGWVSSVAQRGARFTFLPQPRGEALAIGAGDEVRVLSLPDARAVQVLRVHGPGLLNAAIDESGRFVAVSKGSRVDVHDLQTRQRVGRWQVSGADPHRLGFNQMAVSTSGRWVAAAPNTWGPGRPMLWLVDVVTGREIPVQGFSSVPRAMAFGVQGWAFAAADDQGDLRVFRLAGPDEMFTEVARVEGASRGSPSELALSPNGTQVAVSTHGVEVVDLRTRQRTALIDDSGPVLFDALGLHLWVVGGARAADLGRHGPFTRWELATADEFRRALTAQPDRTRLSGLDFMGPTGAQMAVAAEQGWALLDADTGATVQRGSWPPNGPLTGVVATPDGAARTLTADSVLTLTASGAREQPLAVPEWGTHQVLGSDGQHALTFTQTSDVDGQVATLSLTTVSLQTSQVLDAITLPGHQLANLSVAVAGNLAVLQIRREPGSLAHNGAGCRHIELRPLARLRQVTARWTCPTEESRVPATQAVRPDGRELVLASEAEVVVLSLPSLAPKARFAVAPDDFDQFPRAVALSHDGRWIAVLDSARRISVYDREGRSLARLPVQWDASSNLMQMRFSTDGQRLGALLNAHRQLETVWSWTWSSDSLLRQACGRLDGTRPNVNLTPALKAAPGESASGVPMACRAR